MIVLFTAMLVAGTISCNQNTTTPSSDSLSSVSASSNVASSTNESSSTGVLDNPASAVPIVVQDGTAYFSFSPVEFTNKVNTLLGVAEDSPDYYNLLPQEESALLVSTPDAWVAKNPNEKIIVMLSDESGNLLRLIMAGTDAPTVFHDENEAASYLLSESPVVLDVLSPQRDVTSTITAFLNVAQSNMFSQNQNPYQYQEKEEQIGLGAITIDSIPLVSFIPLSQDMADSSVPSPSIETSAQSDAQVVVSETTNPSLADSSMLSTDPFAFQVSFDGAVITIPSSVPDFQTAGFLFSGITNKSFAPNVPIQGVTTTRTNGGFVITALRNQTQTLAPFEQCTIYDVMIPLGKPENRSVVLSGGLTFGATPQQVEAVFGRAPDHTSYNSEDDETSYFYYLNADSSSGSWYELTFEGTQLQFVRLVHAG